MRKFHRRGILIAIAYGLPWMIFDYACFAGEPSAKTDAPSAEEIEKDLSGLEELWKAGKHSTYFVEAAKVAERLPKASDKKNAVRVAGVLLERMLPRKLKAGEVADYVMADENNLPEAGYSDLSAMSRLASFIGDTYEIESWASREERRRHVKLVARFLGRVRAEMVPHYTGKPTALNVAPPDTGGEFGFAGMDPNAIKDPVAKAKYLSAIRENISNGISNSRQQKLRSLDAVMGTNLVNDLIRTFVVWDNSATILAKYMKEARLTDKERKEVETVLARAKTVREKEEAEDREFHDRIKAKAEDAKGGKHGEDARGPRSHIMHGDTYLGFGKGGLITPGAPGLVDGVEMLLSEDAGVREEGQRRIIKDRAMVVQRLASIISDRKNLGLRQDSVVLERIA